MRFLTGFASLAAEYDGFVLDLWGVIHDGVNAFPHAVDCLAELRDAGKKTLLLSNVPRPNDAVRTMMRRMGIDDAHYTDILTDSDVWESMQVTARFVVSTIAIEMLLLGYFIQIVIGVIEDRPVRGRVLAALRTLLLGNKSVTPVKVVFGDTVSGRAAGLLDDFERELNQIGTSRV